MFIHLPEMESVALCQILGSSIIWIQRTLLEAYGYDPNVSDGVMQKLADQITVYAFEGDDLAMADILENFPGLQRPPQKTPELRS